MHCSPKGPYFRDRVPIGTFFTFLGPYLYFRVPIFSVLAKFTQRMSIQSSCTQQWLNLMSKFLHYYCLLWRYASHVDSRVLIFTSAYALNFTNCRFGSLFWLPRVPIGSLFHKKLGPYWVPISKLGGPYKFWEQCIPAEAIVRAVNIRLANCPTRVLLWRGQLCLLFKASE